MSLILSSTLLLVREKQQRLEVFLAVRSKQASFAPGVLVFPGGKVEREDGMQELRARCDGVESIDSLQLALRVAAIRETFEESGVLLVREDGGEDLLSGERTQSLQDYRSALGTNKVSFGEMLEKEKLRLACDWLVPFAHWVTPEPMPRRYDTHFYLAAAPPGQVARHDGCELVDSVWLSPQEALQRAKSGEFSMIFPTRSNVRRLAKSRSVQEALAKAVAQPVVAVTPWLRTSEEGALSLCIPKDAGYDICEEPLE